MAKLSLVASPTFKKKVGIPVAGGEPVMVEMVFKHKTKTALDQFILDRAGKSDTETFMEMVSGWDLEDVFSKENADTLLENYGGAAVATFRIYIDELRLAKVKN